MSLKTKMTPLILLCALITPLSLAAKQTRPNSKTKLSAVKSSCSQWSKTSKQRGISQLIIAFEGLSSFSQSYANKTYELYEAQKSGRSQNTKLKRAAMNFVMKNLIAPHMGEVVKESEILLLSEKTQRAKKASVASTCVESWKAVYGDQLQIIIVGHSFGGYSAINLSQRLQEKNISVKTVFTMDARTYPGKYKEFWRPDNVEQHINHFQKGAWMPGYRVKGAENKKFSTSHSGITKIEESKKAFLDII